MYCIIGLGNPGKKYSKTRHNSGFMVVEKLSSQLGASFKKGFQSEYTQVLHNREKVLLIKPQTFMNLSGEAVLEIVNYFKITPDEILVIYDELDLPLGGLRFRVSGSAGGHKGLTSIIRLLQTDKIARLRLGIGRPPERMPVPDYVLTGFSGAEERIFTDVVSKAAEAALAWIDKGSDYVMNNFNVTPKAENSQE